MTQLLALGATAGLGLFLVVRSVAFRGPSLARSLAALARDPRTASAGGGFERRAARLLRGFGLDGETSRRHRDLRVTGRTWERHAAEKLLAALAGAGLPALCGVLLVAGGVGVPVGLLVAAMAALAVGGFLLPDLLLRDAARQRRGAFTSGLSSYLDLANVVLAGGAGTETALEAAAEAGDGWVVGELRGALTRSRALRRSPWDCLAELGDDLGVTELQELSASIRLAGEQGARVRASLAAKAASLRGHQLARIEAEAQSATERMALPTVLLFTGFLLFIGYPAVAEILGSTL